MIFSCFRDTNCTPCHRARACPPLIPPYSILSYHVLSFAVVSCPILSFPNLLIQSSYPILSCPIPPYPNLSYPTRSCVILSYHSLSYITIFYPNLSYPISSVCRAMPIFTGVVGTVCICIVRIPRADAGATKSLPRRSVTCTITRQESWRTAPSRTTPCVTASPTCFTRPSISLAPL